MSRLNIIRFIYSTLLTVLVPAFILRLYFKKRATPLYEIRWRERLALFENHACQKKGICFHCVSVGETLSIIPLVKKLMLEHPSLQITITTTTATGSKLVKSTFGDSVFHVYLPFDTPIFVKRFFHKIQPQLLVIVETELWPNLIHYSQFYQCKTLVVNARLSKRSAKNYNTKIPTLASAMMQDLSFVMAQHQDDANRFQQLGLNSNKLQVTGSVKFDINVEDNKLIQIQELKSLWANNRTILVAGSTHQGEEKVILEAFKEIKIKHPTALLILVPRHPNRFNLVESLIKGYELSYVKRSSNIPPKIDDDVLLGDSIGELILFWALADIAFIGGSLFGHGGHNPLEPAFFKVPIITGSDIFNFSPIYKKLSQNNGVKIINQPQEISQEILYFLDNKTERLNMGNNAKLVLEQNLGASNKVKKQIVSMLNIN